MRSDLCVIRREVDGGERFAVIETAADLFPQEGWESIGDFFSASFRNVGHRLRSAELLDEPALRTHLVERGLGDEEIDRQIRRARNLAPLAAIPLTFQRITTIGYRNDFGQTVVRKGDAAADHAGQRMFFLRCDACGYEHDTAGSDIHRRRCPLCADA
jgi:hypothetical protein